MRRKIRLSALIAVFVLMLALLIGGLYGYFDDTDTSVGNVFTAGTLNLVEYTTGDSADCNFEVYAENGTLQDPGLSGYVRFLNVAPGNSGNITWTLTNVGSVDGTLYFDNITLSEAENSCTDPEDAVDITPDVGELAANMTITLDKYVGGLFVSTLYSGPLSGLTGLGLPADTEDLYAASANEIEYILSWSIATTVGNVIQSDSATINVTFYLEQTP